MNTIIVYQSSTGFTRQYAQWLSEDLGCDVIDNKKLKPNTLAQYDRVIFGGWIMGGMISGLDAIRKNNPKNLIVFAVGISKPEDETVDSLCTQNHLENTPLYYFPGGLHYDKLGFMKKTMLKMVKKSISGKENKTPKEEYMEKVLCVNSDYSDRKYIAPLVNSLKTY